MKIARQNRSSTKLQMKCFRCRNTCAPKDGDWHNGENNQVFLCHSCVKVAHSSRMVPSILSGSLKAQQLPL